MKDSYRPEMEHNDALDSCVGINDFREMGQAD